MKDVLEVLQKLPAACLVIQDGEVRQSRRGVKGSAPFPYLTRQVDQWNHNMGVSPQQVQAMLVGSSLGWHMDGADPDTHAEDLGEETGPFTYEWIGTVTISVSVVAHTEEQALNKARAFILDCPNDVLWEGRWALQELDLVETDDPNS